MDFQSAMETFAEAWVAANTKGAPPTTTETGNTQVFTLNVYFENCLSNRVNRILVYSDYENGL